MPTITVKLDKKRATAESINADAVGADRAAFERLGARYLRFC